ncbi:RluA family pseudouridine synthase [Halobacillus litoralis]|uniref:Pseudouridine synthase n=1 Tax=Halobacillus litoralis TaxID=45668 RepID=A0A845F8W8_9BACI|nr:RluA family pseudouridine synthase [Halobacillus litoralis]MYL70291.1 RluA family pseudouridine synthase [Halobacillus litoralis]
MTTQSNVTKSWRVTDAYTGYSIRDFLLQAGEFSRQLIKKVRMDGVVLINGIQEKMWRTLEAGDEVVVVFPEEEKGAILPHQGPLPIVFEDEDIMVLNKPAGIPVVPPFDQKEPSIASFLLFEYEQRGYPCTAHIVTRLDRDTSGLMLIAKHAYSHRLLTQNLDLISRQYVAIVEGELQVKEGLIDEPIDRAEDSIIRRVVSSRGKPSKTLYHLVHQEESYSRVRFKLLTGRTHQIRVHMAYKGYPLAGDTLYGGKKVEGMDGQALHCERLHFIHPWTKKKMTFTSEPPREWEAFA